MIAPGGPAPAHSAPKMAPSDLPKGSRELQEAPLDPPEATKGSLRTPRGAQETPKETQEDPKMAQEGSKMAQVGSKVGPEMRKVAKVNLLKKTICFISFSVFLAVPR